MSPREFSFHHNTLSFSPHCSARKASLHELTALGHLIDQLPYPSPSILAAKGEVRKAPLLDQLFHSRGIFSAGPKVASHNSDNTAHEKHSSIRAGKTFSLPRTVGRIGQCSGGTLPLISCVLSWREGRTNSGLGLASWFLSKYARLINLKLFLESSCENSYTLLQP